MTQPDEETIITRRGFCRALTGTVLYPRLAAFGQSDAQSGMPVPVQQDSIAYLMADLAERTPSLTVRTDESRGFVKRFWVENWTDPQQSFEWVVSVRQAGPYEVTFMLSTPPGVQVALEGPQNKVVMSCQSTSPQFFGFNWNRVTLTDPLKLPAGTSRLRVKLLQPVTTKRGAALKSIELLCVAARSPMDARIKTLRSDTSWLNAAKFGFMCQCGEWSFPQSGPHRPWPTMADQFNVKKFAEMVDSTGAGYAIWSATWATYYFPAPIKAIDQILPGRTCRRDLIGEIADALAKKNIRLILYYHAGHGDREWWARNWVSPFDKRLFVDNWCSIMEEVGERYRERLAGWMFDDDLVYYPSPYERMAHAAKTGNRDRIISWNPWIQPRGTDFQDFQFGEGFMGSSALPASSNGIWPDGPMAGLHAFANFQLDGPDWGIQKADTHIEPPRLSSEQAVTTALMAAERNEALSWNLLMYDDGKVSDASLNVLRSVGAAIRKQYLKP